MRVLIFCIALLFLMNCSGQILSQKSENSAANSSSQINSTVSDANANKPMPIPNESDKIDGVRQKELDAQNEKFRVVPDEFKKVDFKNFKYPIVTLKNGEKDERNPKNPLAGGQSFTLSDVFYIDLNRDAKKEAIVMLYAVGCGGSCDGGRSIIYLYSSQNPKPKLIDEIEMGSRSGGCSLKSFSIKDKKITIEQFGRCTKKSHYDESSGYSCKFCVKDLTRSVYFIRNANLIEQSRTTIEEPERNVMNYHSEISISE